jgi:hypothetical protein
MSGWIPALECTTLRLAFRPLIAKNAMNGAQLLWFAATLLTDGAPTHLPVDRLEIESAILSFDKLLFF